MWRDGRTREERTGRRGKGGKKEKGILDVYTQKGLMAVLILLLLCICGSGTGSGSIYTADVT